MCTLSFLPTKPGYLLAMNRDELKDRSAALPPALHQHNSELLVYPQEPSGGTWIAANSRGDLFALMNANAPTAVNLPLKRISRGEIIPYLLRARDLDEANRLWGELPLAGMHPFRLFAIFRLSHRLFQWSWNGSRLTSREHEWIRNHWFSSSRSDARAEGERGRVCEMSWHEGAAASTAWLRALHSSHIPDAGAYSICVHRPDAATVSYTEVDCTSRELRMSYLAGHPCEFHGSLPTVTLSTHA